MDGDSGPVAGDDGHPGVVVLDLFVEMCQILVRVGGVHHQQITVYLKAVKIGVVHRAAILVGDDGVLGLVEIQGHHVAGKHMLEKGDCVGAIHQDAAHVGDVEEAACVAGVQVLGHDFGGILDGHLPAPEVHHSGSGSGMDVVELGALEIAHKAVSS